MFYSARRLSAALFALAISAGASAGVIATNDTYAVLDGSEDTRTFDIGSHGTITDLNITIAFSKCDDPAIGADGIDCLGRGNPFENEFLFALAAPDGTIVTLVEPWETYNGANGSAGRVSVTFDDAAANRAGPKVRNGTFRPEQPLELFNGMDMYGSWTLYLQDFGFGDPLEFFSAQLNVSFASSESTDVPEPASLAIMGLGLLGISLLRRKSSRK